MFFITLIICCLHYVLSVLEVPNTKTNSLCANILGNKALSDTDMESEYLQNIKV